MKCNFLKIPAQLFEASMSISYKLPKDFATSPLPVACPRRCASINIKIT